MYKCLYGWRSERDFINRGSEPDSKKLMYLRLETKTVEEVTSVTETPVTDLGFDDVVSLGKVIDRCMNLKVWKELTQLEREGWIESTIANSGTL